MKGAKSEAGRIQTYEYPVLPCESSLPEWLLPQEPVEAPEPEEPKCEPAPAPVQTVSYAELEKRLAEEARKSFEAGRERGRQEGRQEGQKAEQEAHAAADKAAEERRLRQAMELVETFAEERDRYMLAVEREVVKLALAVAARILRREAQMDPLLLTGAVRVALGQLSGSTEVRLKVPPAELDLWTDAISTIPNLAVKPEVIPGEAMRLGDCVIETSLGSVDLGIRSQLGEIERGFFDRAGGPRPPAKAAADNQAAMAGTAIGNRR